MIEALLFMNQLEEELCVLIMINVCTLAKEDGIYSNGKIIIEDVEY